MDFIRRCEIDLQHLNKKYEELLAVPYNKRDFNAVRIVQDMIADIEFALFEYRYGYCPQDMNPAHFCFKNYRKEPLSF